MKIEPINFMYGGMSFELVPETNFETALLNEAFKSQKMTVSGGKFFIEVFKESKK
ncbi:hypothetical protein LCGC14_0610370 [marine sediment metagenome]|uniref:Uncharacterized protein n=1 Tax=marine sediment metagenome TaxID=412755 RepID=A0A0F9UGA9_9ZZZZ